ncbi:MAG: ABC transporter substrate-binding protein [Deltaproteobacteria bacterium]|nr:ABC transporter substrate-binding protein [Deltaproteobacteria bacterium]
MSRQGILVVVGIVALFGISYWARIYLGANTFAPEEMNAESRLPKNEQDSSKNFPGQTASKCERIVSLAPSLTEIVFALGLGDRLVGVTRYCDYPEAAKSKKKIGGYYDPSNEAIMSLKPDMVIMLDEHLSATKMMMATKTPHLNISNRRIFDILNAITTIGGACGVSDAASQLRRQLQSRIDGVKSARSPGQKPKTVMITTGRNMGSGTISDAYITGREGYYDEMIAIAGGINVYQGNVAFPMVSAEGILEMNPDIVIDMVPDLDESVLSKEQIIQQWSVLGHLRAVQTGQVYVLTEDYVVVPGPRFVLLLERLAKILGKANALVENEK